MTTTYGRISTPKGPRAPSWSGDVLTMRQQFMPATLEQAKVIRQQWLGLAETQDERVIPITSTSDPDLDGFYEVVGVECDPHRTYLDTNIMEGSIGLRRVANGYARPMIEVAYVVSEVVNPHAGTERARIGIPNVGREVMTYGEWLSPLYITTASGGSVGLLSAAVAFPFAGSMQYQVEPASFYDGAATFEVQIGGTWYPVVGNQIPAGWTKWRLTNDWIRMGPSSTSAPFYMLLEAWNGSSWVTVGTFERGSRFGGVWTRHDFATSNPQNRTAPGTNTLAYPSIVRNTPEQVVVKLPQNLGHETWSIARGDAFVRGYYIDRDLVPRGVGMSTAIAVTDATSNMVRTTAASSFKFFVSTPFANSVDAVNGRIYTDAASQFMTFAIGYSTPNTYSTFDEATYTMGVAAQQQRVSAR